MVTAAERIAGYRAFLAAKTRQAPLIGRESADAEVSPVLHPWQRRIVRWAVQVGRGAVWADTGLGKTFIELEFARLAGVRSLILAPLAVCQQTVREASKLGITARYARSDADADGPGIWVTNYEMALRFDPARLDAVVLDECFAPGTPIDMADGTRKRIEDIRAGDEIINAAGTDTVSDVHRREVPYAVRVSFGGNSVLSSPNHPWFTQRGWVGAQDLQPGDSLLDAAEAVRMVREAVPEEVGHGTAQRAVLQSVLLSEMADEAARAPGEGAYAGSCSEARREQAHMAGVRVAAGSGGDRADSRPQPDCQPRSTGQDLPHLESDEPHSFRAWGQWPWLDRAAAESAGCSWTELAGGVRFVTGPTHTRLSDELQARLGAARTANRHRSGWALAPLAQGAGRKEGRQAGFTRVDGIEILQSGDPRLDRVRDAGGRLCFYDLGATRHPSFSVAGRLVHNSSILKQSDGKTRNSLIRHFAGVRFRLACTATPAPNDTEELTSQAEFLGVMPRAEMLAAYFVHDDEGWRVKGHARGPMFRWMASWAVALRRPSDIGGDDSGYVLPGYDVVTHLLPVDAVPEGQLFATDLGGIGGRAKVRKATLEARCEQTARTVNAEPGEPWIVWCGRNDEADLLARLIPGAVNVHGSMTPEEKADGLLGFADGKIRVLVTKPKVASFGMNFQHCARMAFCGLDDSMEQYYQAIRRCHRYGQTRRVQVHVVLSELEGRIAENVARKEARAAQMTEELVREMRAAGELRAAA